MEAVERGDGFLSQLAAADGLIAWEQVQRVVDASAGDLMDSIIGGMGITAWDDSRRPRMIGSWAVTKALGRITQSVYAAHG